MKKLLLILLCLPIMTLAQKTYVPDDVFEAWIEATYPNANNGIANDDSVLTSGLNIGNNTGVTINNNSGPIFDLTGIEDFKCSRLKVNNTFITNLDLSLLDLYQVYSELEVSSNQYLEQIILPNNNDTINTVNLDFNDSLNNIIFQPLLRYNTIYITNHLNLCEINFKGQMVNVLGGTTPTIYISYSPNIKQLDFSGITSAPYQTNIILHLITNTINNPQLFQINLNNNISIYNWFFNILGFSVSDYSALTCVEVSSQTDADFCTGNNNWPDLYYTTNCYNPINCQISTIIVEQSNINKELLKVTDLLGRETKGTKNEVLFYIYDDGTVEKRIVIE